jgi:hypothetical protein
MTASFRGVTRQIWTVGQVWPRTRAVVLAAALIAACTILNYVLILNGFDSTVWLARDWLKFSTPDVGDSWNVMFTAREWLATHADKGQLYNDIFFGQGVKFQYAPTSLLPLDGLAAIGIEPTNALLNRINQVLIGASAAGVGYLVWLLLERLAPARTDIDCHTARVGTALVATVGALLFFPLLMGGELGQLQVWINALFIAAAIAWLRNSRLAAGLLIGLICILKPQFGLFAVWGALRREWSFTIALAVTALAGLLASIALYGFASHWAYLDVLGTLSRQGESYWPNQSFNGILNRLVHEGPFNRFDVNGFPDFNPLVYAGTLVTTAAILAYALLADRAKTGLASIADFMLAALAFTTASPIAWEHHYGVVAPMLALIFAVTVAMQPGRARLVWGAALALAFVFSANLFSVVKDFTGIATLASAYIYFAALGVLVLLRRLVTTPVL